jgi:tRNA A37 methylthiotransferase MiaB
MTAFASHPNLCPHLHLSCQSGDDPELKAMNRPYDTAFYKALVRRLREAIPDLAITTDLIVGYPGETEAMHQNTLQFAREVGFQRTHVFSYSPRPKTYAETLTDDVPHDTKKRRHKELQAVVDETNTYFTARYLSETLPVLIEAKEGQSGQVSGHTTNYIKVSFPAPPALIGQIVPVRLTHLTDDGNAVGTLALSEADVATRLATAPRFGSLELTMAQR